VIGEHDRFMQYAADQGNIGCVQLGQVQVDDISLANLPPGPIKHAWHEHTLTDVGDHARTDDLDTLSQLTGRQAAVVARGEDGHLVAALDQGVSQPFSVDG